MGGRWMGAVKVGGWVGREGRQKKKRLVLFYSETILDKCAMSLPV